MELIECNYDVYDYYKKRTKDFVELSNYLTYFKLT